jgi:CheY-like chemotaxis protein
VRFQPTLTNELNRMLRYRMKVLIVDDNEKVRLRYHLPVTADEVYECADGAEALSLFKKHRPDWVLMDQASGCATGPRPARRCL